MVHQHLAHHYPGHHTVLILPHHKTPGRALWRGHMAAHCYCNDDKLCKSVEQAFTTIMPQIITADGGHIRLCFEHDCSYTGAPDVHWLLPHGILSRGMVTSWPLCILAKDVSNMKQQAGNCRIHAEPK
jgi:hypothetical protein